MGIMVVEVYDALREAGASENTARAAAGSIPVKDELATKSDLAELQSATKTELAEFRAEMEIKMAELRAEMAEFRAEVRTEIAKLRSEMYRQLWVMAVSIVLATVTLTKLIQ